MGSCYRCIHNPSCKFHAVISLIVLQLTGYSALLQQVLILGILAFLGGNLLLGIAYFAPTIIRSMGYSPIRRQLMSVPPYAATFVISVALAILLIAGVSAVIAFSSLGSLLWQGTLFSTPQTTPPFSTGRLFCKQWERSLPPQPAPRGTPTTSNLITSAPLLLGL